MPEVVISSSQRKALLSLKSTSSLLKRTQDRLATGLAVSSAIDGPEAYFQAKSLSDRAKDLQNRVADIDQAISLVSTAQDGLSGIENVLKQMKGLVLASTEAGTQATSASQFDEMLNQLNRLVDDAYYQGINLLANASGQGQAVTTYTHTVQFSEKTAHKVELAGQFAGSDYYLSTGGSAKLIPDATGSTVTVSGTSTGAADALTGEVLVNTTTAGDQGGDFQYGSQVAALSDGGYVVAWIDQSTLEGDKGIYFQRYDSGGTAVGGETRVPNTSANDQSYPDVTGLTNGGFVITWQDVAANAPDAGGIGLKGQVFDANGAEVGAEFQLNNSDGTNNELGDQTQSVVTALTGGGFAVAWQGQSVTDASGIATRVFNADGTAAGNQVQVNQTIAGNQGYQHITSLADGGFLMTWADATGVDGSGWAVMARRFDASGTAVTSEFVVNSTTAGDQIDPSGVGLADGGFVVAWQDGNGADGSGAGVYARRYDSNGNAVGAQFLVNTTTANDQGQPDTVALADGGFMVTWADTAADGSGTGVYAQRYDSSANKVGSEFLVNTTTANAQSVPKLAELNGGQGFVAIWEDSALDGSGQGVYHKRYSAGLTAGTLSASSITSVNYTTGLVTATIGGVAQTLTVTKQGLGVAHSWYYQGLANAEGRNAAISDIDEAINTVRSISSTFGSKIALLQTRFDFTGNYIETLTAGADKLTLADLNEEGANTLALQTRQQLGIQSLSFGGKAEQGILDLFR